jgi:glycosyltransferase involved in cell wall biosynthesis
MHWESGELVRQFIERGYIVDCLFDRNGGVIDDVSEYDVIVDEWINLPRWAAANTRAKTLHYATGCHWLFHNEAELARNSWLFARRQVVAPTRRQVPPILGPGTADLISTFGSQANIKTFGAYGPKVRRLKISSVVSPGEPRPKAWGRARRRFLWFGGSGWVHKGLDLVVEAFLQEPHLELVICGGSLAEEDVFWRTYGREIEQAGNISYRGFLDPEGQEFESIVDSVCAVVYPSAAEGCSGAIVQCLHFGLIPIVTEITGLDVHTDWPALEGDSDGALIQDVRRRCSQMADLPEARLGELQRYFWSYARRNHTRDAYRQSLALVLDELLAPAEAR